MRCALVFVVGALCVSGCGRVRFVPNDAGDERADVFTTATDADLDALAATPDAYLDPVADAFAPMADAFAADAVAPMADAFAPDAFAADAFVAPGTFVVTNTLASGPGSLENAITAVNVACTIEPSTITFDIPMTDPGFVMGAGGRRWWRISSLATRFITCANTIIDGTTQTASRGDTNNFVVSGVPAGVAGVPLPELRGPEIELRGIDLGTNADGVTLRGLALAAYVGSGTRLTIEQCFFGSEPDELIPLPAPARYTSEGYVFYTQTCTSCMVRESVFMAANGTATTYNLFSFRTGSVGATLRDSYFGGTVTGAGSWDLLYLVEAEDHRILHNYFAASGYEYFVEWVPGFGGQISDNTFIGTPSMTSAISSGGAAVMTGNVFTP